MPTILENSPAIQPTAATLDEGGLVVPLRPRPCARRLRGGDASRPHPGQAIPRSGARPRLSCSAGFQPALSQGFKHASLPNSALLPRRRRLHACFSGRTRLIVTVMSDQKVSRVPKLPFFLADILLI